jgi:large subunit ribosomal protein L5
VALPRTRDSRGLSSKSFDGQGNYSFGIKEQVVFPEIDYDKVDTIRGMDVIITTSAGNDEISYEMLKAMGLPIKEKSVQTEEVPVEEDNLNEEKNGEEV